jgi:hypothetical protein
MVCSGLLAGAVPASAASSAGTWGRAEEMPGSGALNKGGWATFGGLSCWSPGDCLAGGTYTINTSVPSPTGAFLDTERDGIWAKVTPVPGLAALNKGDGAVLNAVSCASAGNCVAGGWYTDRTGAQQAFVVSERDGAWGKAIKVTGPSGFNAGGVAEVNDVSCGYAGDCSAVGDDIAAVGTGGIERGFVVTEHDGTWGKAVQVAGYGKDGGAEVDDVSCTGAGSCGAGGVFNVAPNEPEVFVMTERNGTWGSPIEVPGYAALNWDSPDSGEALESVSCPAVGDCSAGGVFTSEYGMDEAFVVSETDGTWGKAMRIPGFTIDNQGSESSLDSVSCVSAGNCTAGGSYGITGTFAFVVTQTDGVWGHPENVPGLALDARQNAGIGSVSCTSPGDCGASGSYTDAHNRQQAFVVSETDGTWGRAELIPNSEALNKGGAASAALSCTAAGRCSAGGYYWDAKTDEQLFVATEN